MPIRVANDIPAKNQLTEEGIIFMEETRASSYRKFTFTNQC